MLPITRGCDHVLGIAMIDASATAGDQKESAGSAAYLFAVVGVLLIVFWSVVMITTITRGIRRRQRENAASSEPTDLSVDAWSEAGKRLDRDPRGDRRA